MTLKAWPAVTWVTETTPSSNGLRRRLTRLWRPVTTCAAASTGSVVWCGAAACPPLPDRKSTRLNSSHSQISYAVFCLKKKKNKTEEMLHGHTHAESADHNTS